MLTPLTGRVRLARAAVVGGMVLGLSLGAHVLAGGGTPPALLLVAVAAFLLLGCVVLAGRRFTPVRLLALLGAGQWALHLLFEWFGRTACTVTAAPSTLSGQVLAEHAGHAGHVSDAGLAVACAPAAEHAGHVAGAPEASGLAMLLAHVAATLVVAALVTRGERALWSAAEALVAVVGPVLLHPWTPVRPVPAPHPETDVRVDVQAQHHARSAPRRGPPAAGFSLAA